MIFELLFALVRESSLKRLAVAFVTSLLIVVSLNPMAEVAEADSFTSDAGPPSMTPISVTDDTPNAFVQFQPAFPESTDVYTVSTTVTKPGGIGTLSNGLTMCLWLVSSSDCRNANDDGVNLTPNAQTTFIMTWNWDSVNDQDVFTVIDDAGNNYQNVSSASNYSAAKEDQSQVSATVDFSFKVSNAMRHSFDWNIQMRADDGTNVTFENLSNIRTNYFGSVTTQRSAANYSVNEMGFDMAEGRPMGAYTANANSDITIQASDFVEMAEGNVMLDLDNPNVVITMSCSDTTQFDDNADIVMDSTIQAFSAVNLIGDEAPEQIGDHSCRMEYSKYVDAPNRMYSNTVTIGIGPADNNAPTSLSASTTQTSATLTWTTPLVVSGGSATLNSYVIEISSDGGSTWQFVDRITSGNTYAVSSLAERSSYDFRVTANTSAGAGIASVTAETNSSAIGDLQTAQQLNLALNSYDEDSNLCDIVTEIENAGFTVFATPTYGAMAEQMSALDTSKLCTAGRFRLDLFDNNTALGKLAGFGGNLDGQPFIGMAGFGGNSYLGTAYMGFTDLNAPSSAPIGADDVTYLHQLFLNDDLEKEFSAYALNANGTTVNDSTTVMETRWSDGMNPGSRGYNATYRFSADDFVWGYSSGSTSELDGNGGAYLSSGSRSFGIENRNGGDSTSGYFWNGSRSGTDYLYIMFIGEEQVP